MGDNSRNLIGDGMMVLPTLGHCWCLEWLRNGRLRRRECFVVVGVDDWWLVLVDGR